MKSPPKWRIWAIIRSGKIFYAEIYIFFAKKDFISKKVVIFAGGKDMLYYFFK